MLRIGRHHNRCAACQLNTRRIGDICRIRNKNFITGRNKGRKSHGQPLGNTHRYDNFINRVIFHAVMSIEIFGNGFPQLGKPRIARIACLFFIDTVDHGLPDLFRCREIRFTDTEGKNTFNLIGNIKEFTNSRRFNFFYIRSNKIIPIHVKHPFSSALISDIKIKTPALLSVSLKRHHFHSV